MRSLAEQNAAEPGSRWSVLERQKQDIMRDRSLEGLRGSSGPGQDEVLRRVSWPAFSHALAAETVLWPAIRRALPDGQERTTRIEEEHQQIKETRARLEQIDPDGAERPALVDRGGER